MHIYKTLITLQFYIGHMQANDPFRDIVKSFHFENQHVILGWSQTASSYFLFSSLVTIKVSLLIIHVG